MNVLVYGNCQCKVISSYLSEQPFFKNSLVKYFFVTHPVEMLDLEFVRKVDIFIYQHVKQSSLISQYPKTTLFNYTPEGLIATMKPSVKFISIPSIYFSGLYPNSYSIDEMRPRLPKTTKIDWYANHTFNKKVFDALEKNETTETVANILLDPELYNSQTIENNVVQSLSNLRWREKENKVDIPVSDFLEQNYRLKQLSWTTNHPTKFVFNYIIQEILTLLDLPPDETLLERPDKLDQDIYPIFSCVRKYLCLDPIEFPLQARVNNRKFTDMNRYIQFYKDTLDGKNVGELYPQDKLLS